MFISAKSTNQHFDISHEQPFFCPDPAFSGALHAYPSWVGHVQIFDGRFDVYNSRPISLNFSSFGIVDGGGNTFGSLHIDC